MATQELRLSAKVDKQTGRSEIILRFFHGKVVDHNAKTGIYILPKYWDAKKREFIIKDRLLTEETKYHTEAKARLENLCNEVAKQFNYTDKKAIQKDWLKLTVDKINFPEKYADTEDAKTSQPFFDTFDEFLQKRRLSVVREKNFLVLKRALQRYELFVSYNEKRSYKLELDTITAETIMDFESFLRNEHVLFSEYPQLYAQFPAIIGTKRKSPKPQPRGNNTICALFNKLRAFFNWCNDNEKTTNRPFAKYEGVTSEKYGRPFYISLDERNQIAEFDLSAHPHLVIQRDIFIFQCLIGCRVSDLLRMTAENIIDGAVEYIPHKTEGDRPHVVRVPLNDRAKALVLDYKGVDATGKLFPFISAQKYNASIKEIFRICGITRIVTVINPTTNKEEKRPINEVASSHLARRTFVGNLYKQVKDPNLVGSLSGHKEGSKAFARYRDIDDEIKNELVKMLD